MKVTLISPDHSNILTDPSMSEPLGLMYIEEMLVKYGQDVKFVDLSFDTEIPIADIYCFTSSTATITDTIKVASKVEGIKIIGGPHATALPNTLLDVFDIVVMGVGETTIGEIIKCISQRKFEQYVFDNQKYDVNDIPIPRRTIWNRLEYHAMTATERSATVMTARGCPNNCSFCASNLMWGRKVQFRDVDNIIQEIQYLQKEYDIHSFKFIDDVFTLRKNRFLQLVDRLSDLNIKWTCNTRIDSLDKEILDGLIKGGCSCVDVGLESVEDKALAGIHKNQTANDCRRAIRLIKDRGLDTKIYLVHGLPHESVNIVENTIKFIEETKPTYVSLFTLVPYPGTDIWNNPEKHGIAGIKKDFSEYRHAIGKDGKDLDLVPNIEYSDRTTEMLLAQRRQLVKFVNQWNLNK